MKLTLALAAGALAAPATKQFSKRDLSDIQILNYALTLEHLENAFYRDGIAKFGQAGFNAAGYGDVWFKNLEEIGRDESTHVSFLSGAITALGAKPVEECTYDFGYTDVGSFVGLARVLEGVGITAYLGAAASIADKAYLTYAGSILTVESRHSSYLRGKGKPTRSPFPQSFDTPQDFNEVYSLASQYIVSCPSDNPSLPLKAFPVLNMLPWMNGHPLVPHNTYFYVQAPDGPNFSQPIYAYFLSVTGPVSVPVMTTDDPTKLRVKTPKVASGIAGQTYLVITNAQSVTDDTIVAGPAIVRIKTNYLPGTGKMLGY